jgi:hypothetical protein
MPRTTTSGGGEQGHFFDPTSWQALVAAVAQIARDLGLDVETEVYVGRRIWGARRRIDIVVTDPTLRWSLGIEVKYQRTAGSAEEKIPATIDDIAAWPIPGMVVFHGPGFSTHMRSFLQAAGKAVELEDLETWLRLYFVLGSARPSLSGDAEDSDRRSTSAG